MRTLIQPAIVAFAMILHASVGFANSYSFNFAVGNSYQQIELEIPASVVSHYDNKPHYRPSAPDRSSLANEYAKYGMEDAGYAYLRSVSEQLTSYADAAGYTGQNQVEYVVAFAQHLKYFNEQGEYVRYPVETIVDRGGDCEDTALLIVALLTELGYDSRLVLLEGHMMAALACPDCSGSSITFDGQRFALIEATTPSRIGYCAPEYLNRNCNVGKIGGVYNTMVYSPGNARPAPPKPGYNNVVNETEYSEENDSYDVVYDSGCGCYEYIDFEIETPGYTIYINNVQVSGSSSTIVVVDGVTYILEY